MAAKQARRGSTGKRKKFFTVLTVLGAVVPIFGFLAAACGWALSLYIESQVNAKLETFVQDKKFVTAPEVDLKIQQNPWNERVSALEKTTKRSIHEININLDAIFTKIKVKPKIALDMAALKHRDTAGDDKPTPVKMGPDGKPIEDSRKPANEGN